MLLAHLTARARSVQQHICRSWIFDIDRGHLSILAGTPKMEAVEISKPPDLAENTMVSDMTMHIQKERGLGRGHVDVMLGSVAGNQENSAAC